ncbi:MAG TPA: VOC family protein [Nitrospiraceae bacterium]|nr:VOC family protein [Nitrospiraceae bacterium]
MKVTEIAFTVYPVTDLKRARQFYEATLGLKEARFFGDEKQGFVEYDIGSGTLAIGIGAPEWKPSRGGGCAALEVDDFDEAMNRLRASGCKITVEPMETPVCHMAVVSDPDGNSVMIHQRKAG